MTNFEKQVLNIQYILFEISNLCQYSEIHTWCPKSKLDKDFRRLEISEIKTVVQFFKPHGFSGTVYLSLYNEPTLDNRLLDMIKYVKTELPLAKISLFTNGLNLDFKSVENLIVAGLTQIMVSGYENSETKRLNDLTKQVKQAFNNYDIQAFDRINPGVDHYDDRILNYDRILNSCEKCYMPIQFFSVYSNGGVSGCFDDWKQSLSFGNIYTDKIEQILMNETRLKMIEDLKQGKRSNFGVCSGCSRPLEQCIAEYRDRIIF